MRDDSQLETPYLDALVEYVKSDPVPFDVPGHKLGLFETDLSRKISKKLLDYDANAPIGLDNLYNPHGVIQRSEELMARLCGADKCLFSVNGTTGGILSSFLCVLDAKDQIIIPRNCHKSVINALIISGATPIFIKPDIDSSLGIANACSLSDYVKAMDENPRAKAVFVINPTYFGICPDIKGITQEAHKRGMVVIADEAHGSAFYFSKNLPMSAMEAGCDISLISMHKNAGSLTQSSIILVKGDRVRMDELKRAYSMLSSTSPNPFLIASIDAARKEMYVRGEEVYSKNLELGLKFRKMMEGIQGISVLGREYIKDRESAKDIDLTKLVISVKGLGMYGYDAYKELRRRDNIQLELGEVFCILALIGPGTKEDDIIRLREGLIHLSESSAFNSNTSMDYVDASSYPRTIVPPRDAYDAPDRIVPLEDSIGEISSETVMAYPPGIPLVIPGELIDESVVKKIQFYYKEGGEVLKDSEHGKIKVIDKSRWFLHDEFYLP